MVFTDTIIRNVSAAAPTMFKQASTVMKVQINDNYLYKVLLNCMLQCACAIKLKIFKYTNELKVSVITIDKNTFVLTCTVFLHSVQSLKSLKQAAEGLRQVLDMQPSAETVEVYREVFGSSVGEVCLDLHHRLPSSIKRAASDSEYSADYVPAPKIIQKTDANAI